MTVDHTGDEQDGRGDSFVVQEHHATALHWDLRLERDGVLVSWAVPKGLPLDPRANRLARQTEDHALEHAAVGRDAAPGAYGRGHVAVWDSGTYELERWRADRVDVVLHGSRVDGRYVLFRTDGDRWMVHRRDPAPPGWTPLPAGLRPASLDAGPLPAGDVWSYEPAWQGARVLVAVEGGRLRVTGDTGADVTGSVPELRGLGLQLGSRQVLLDGEVVVPGAAGRPDHDGLERRRATLRPGRALLRDLPVQLLVADLLHVEGTALLDRPYGVRRELLEALALGGPAWQTTQAVAAEGEQLLEAARRQGLPGVLARDRTARYGTGVVLVPT